jgi:hypothetical protein
MIREPAHYLSNIFHSGVETGFSHGLGQEGASKLVTKRFDNLGLVCCVAVNFGMGQWGEEVFLTLARAAAGHEKGKRLECPTDLGTGGTQESGGESKPNPFRGSRVRQSLRRRPFTPEIDPAPENSTTPF